MPELRRTDPRAGGQPIPGRGVLPSLRPGSRPGEGSFLGPVVINYGVTVFGFILPIIILYACKLLSPAATLALAGGAALFLPILFYRLSWAWWVMLYYFVLTDNLPANRGDRPQDDE